jgi:predicted dehydrogenase
MANWRGDVMEATPICVIGGGQIGERHAQVAARSDLVELTAVVEPVAERRSQLRDMGYPVVAAIDEVPAHTRGAVIATPTADHPNSAKPAMDRGWAVIVEKPPAGTLGESRDLIEYAHARQTALFVGHHRRCHPFMAAARDRLDQIGNLVAIQGVWSLRKHDTYYDVPWRKLPGAGPLLTNMTHEFELLSYFFGPVASVTAQKSTKSRGGPLEDTAAIIIEFTNGCIGTFLLSDAGASPWSFEAGTGENPMIGQTGQDYVRMIGDAGALSFPSLDLWLPPKGKAAEWRVALKHNAAPRFEPTDPLEQQINRFAAAINGEPADLCSAMQGHNALAATLAAAYSADLGRRVALDEVPMDYRGHNEG